MDCPSTISTSVLCQILVVLLVSANLFSCRERQIKTTKKQSVTLASEQSGFEHIFDGTSLKNWKGDSIYWHVENGNIIGEITLETLLRANTFLIYKDELNDFELKMEFRISESGNSGINYRSEMLDTIPYAMRGYQADIDWKHRYTGQNYEERKRTTLAYRGEKVVISSQENANNPGFFGAQVKNNAWQSRKVTASLGHKDSLRTKINNDWNEAISSLKGTICSIISTGF